MKTADELPLAFSSPLPSVISNVPLACQAWSLVPYGLATSMASGTTKWPLSGWHFELPGARFWPASDCGHRPGRNPGYFRLLDGFEGVRTSMLKKRCTRAEWWLSDAEPASTSVRFWASSDGMHDVRTECARSPGAVSGCLSLEEVVGHRTRV